MGLYKSLFKQTAVYGLATVLPRMLSFLLVKLYTNPNVLPNRADYGELSIILAWVVFFNVILSYGMETAFFRFYNAEKEKDSVVSTSLISIFWSSLLFLFIALLSRNSIAEFVNVDKQYITFSIWILVLDALVVIPFSKLRVLQKTTNYALIKIGNVIVNLGLNLFFLLYLPSIAKTNPKGFLATFYLDNFQVGYIFVANIIASLLTFLILSPDYLKIKWNVKIDLWKRMMKYGLPILFAGIAFAINEHFDKILLGELLPENIAKSDVGAYSACYKIGLFMVLFRTAYSLGIEPFFFSHADKENATQTYATITKYFIIFGSFISLAVIVFSDIIKVMLLDNKTYWEAMKVVPIIIFANFFLGIYTNLSVWYKLIDRTKVGAYISLVGAVITLLVNIVLIPKYSYLGSAIATIVAYGSMMLISYLLGKKHYPIPYEISKIFSFLGLSIFFSGLYFYGFRENYYIGLSFIIAFMYFIYYTEKELILTILKSKIKS